MVSSDGGYTTSIYTPVTTVAGEGSIANHVALLKCFCLDIAPVTLPRILLAKNGHMSMHNYKGWESLVLLRTWKKWGASDVGEF